MSIGAAADRYVVQWDHEKQGKGSFVIPAHSIMEAWEYVTQTIVTTLEGKSYCDVSLYKYADTVSGYMGSLLGFGKFNDGIPVRYEKNLPWMYEVTVGGWKLAERVMTLDLVREIVQMAADRCRLPGPVVFGCLAKYYQSGPVHTEFLVFKDPPGDNGHVHFWAGSSGDPVMHPWAAGNRMSFECAHYGCNKMRAVQVLEPEKYKLITWDAEQHGAYPEWGTCAW